MQPQITCDNLSFGYSKQRILNEISFEIQKGEYIGIIGPNGGGKTTLLRLMLGLLVPSSGDILIEGSRPNTREARRKIGYVSQQVIEGNLSFPATVAEIVRSGRTSQKAIFSFFNAKDHEVVLEAMKSAEVYDLKDRQVGDLSGGQRQRVFIAKALASKPDILFLDEPFAGVDAGAQHRFYEFLRKLKREKNITIVMISHDVDMISREVDRVLCMQGNSFCAVSQGEFNKDKFLQGLHHHEFHHVPHEHLIHQSEEE